MNARNTNPAPPTPSVQTCKAATSANVMMDIKWIMITIVWVCRFSSAFVFAATANLEMRPVEQ